MSNITIFKGNSGLFRLRALEINGEPWFVAKDVCEILELGNPSQTLSRLDEDEKNTIILNEGIGNPEKSIVNEPGLYSLILGSRKPEARAFKRWITHEVIPQIRKTGVYIAPKIDSKMLYQIAQALEEKERQIALMTPKAESYDNFISKENLYPINDVAKKLAIPGLGEKKLFIYLRGRGILCSSKSHWNEPKQEYVNAGYFVLRDGVSWFDKKGNEHIPKQTFVTPKGVDFISRMLERDGYIGKEV